MSLFRPPARIVSLVLGLGLMAAAPAFAQETRIRFQLDWRFEGPAAFFTLPASKGYFKDERLDVTIDAGNGSGGTITRVATGTYDMGFADLAALMEFHANNPTATNKPVAVMMVYNNTPAAVFSLKKTGIKNAKTLELIRQQ
jgi:NitT/TauT family transport system substrate-binding protein